MPSVSVNTKSGSAIEFNIPEPGSYESCFFVGMHKGGSTMLANIAKSISARTNFSFYSFPIDLWRKGVKFDHLTPEVQKIFMREGYCYGGFKGLVDPIRLPSFASGRTIFLARDPRDMLTSQYFSVAISHPPPGASLSTDRIRAFEARRAKVLTMEIDDYALKAASAVANAYDLTLSKLKDVDHKLYRYEDVVFDKIRWVEDITSYLDLNLTTDNIEEIVRRVDVVPQKENSARHVRKVTPGDHREKLQPATIDILNKKFADILRMLHYR